MTFDRTEIDSPTPVAIDDEERVQPDTLLPAQLTRPPAYPPERALVAALLRDAIDCFLEHHGATTAQHRQLYEDAAQWIFGTDRAAAFSFEDVCDFLSVDADCLRTALLRWCTRQATRPNATIVRHQRRRPPALRPLGGTRAA